MRKGLVVAAAFSVLACRAPKPAPPIPETEIWIETRFDDEGWSAALDAVKGTWATLPDSATSITFVLDERVRDESTFPIVRGRVEIDGTPLTLDDGSRVAGVVVAPGRHTLSFEIVVGGPPCIYCSMYALRLSRKNVPIDLDARTSSVMRVGVRASGSITKPIEERVEIVVEARAWRRLSEENVSEIAREATERCIDHGTRAVARDRQEKDLIKLLCHKDKLDRCAAALARIVAHAGRLTEARTKGDATQIAREVDALAVLHRSAVDADAEIPYCVGY